MDTINPFPNPPQAEEAKPPRTKHAGRPRAAEGEKYDYQHKVLMRHEEEDLIRRAASHTGMSIAVFIRNSAVMAARRALKEE